MDYRSKTACRGITGTKQQVAVTDNSIENTNKKDIKISVVIPVYNAEKYINKCIDSLMEQKYDNLEIVAVNDGSKDCTGDVLRSYGDRIKLIEVENGGVARARNIGLANSTGEFVLFLDSDDCYEKNAVCELVEFQQKTDADIVIFGYKTVFPGGDMKFSESLFANGKIIEKKDFKKEIYPHFIKGIKLNSVWRALYKKSCIENIKFREDMRTAEDAVFNLDAYTNAQSAAYLDNMYYCYIQNGTGLTGSGLKIKEKYKYNFIFSKEIIKHLETWGMNNIIWRTRTLMRPVVLTFDKVRRIINL